MISKNGGKSIDLTYTVNGRTNNVKTNKAIAQQKIPNIKNVNSIIVTNNKENIVYISLSQKGKLPLGEELAEQRNFYLKTTFLDGEGKTIEVSKLKQGTEINAQIIVTNKKDYPVKDIALSQIFPSGWEIVNTSFTDLGQTSTTKNTRYTDIKDDRVNFYFDLSEKQSKIFYVKLNSSYLGKYYLPGTQVEAMYDNNHYARNKGKWVVVEP